MCHAEIADYVAVTISSIVKFFTVRVYRRQIWENVGINVLACVNEGKSCDCKQKVVHNLRLRWHQQVFEEWDVDYDL